MSRKIRYELEDPSDWIERETEDGRMMARELRQVIRIVVQSI